jgi:hypothetical protein
MQTANVMTVAMNLRLVIENFMKVGNPNVSVTVEVHPLTKI